ncbi:hypothetical protein M405DRAFT_747514, partial [Rhizopogon salebrosus TDB-379]
LDLDKAIVFHREILSLLPVGHPSRLLSLNSLASALAIHLAHRGNGEDLDEVIVLYRKALDLRPVGHPDRAASLNNLADVLCTCFKHRGRDKDLMKRSRLSGGRWICGQSVTCISPSCWITLRKDTLHPLPGLLVPHSVALLQRCQRRSTVSVGIFDRTYSC